MMNRLLLVLASLSALSAWGQTGLGDPQAASGAGPKPDRSVTIAVQPGGQPNQLSAPKNAPGGLLGADQTTHIDNQTGCPVKIVNASFQRPAQLMLASQANAANGPTLDLDYRNFSGKEIDSVVLTGWIKVKDSPYQLDYTTRAFSLRLSRNAPLGKDAQATEALRLASNAFGLDRIELSQVIYADGSAWSPDLPNCVYHANRNLERAEAR